MLSHPDFTPQPPPSAEQGCWQRADASEERAALPAVKSCVGEGQAHGCEVSRGGRFHVGKDKRGSGDREDASVSIDWEGSGTAYEGDIRAVSQGTLLWLDACPSSRLCLRADRRHADIVTFARTLNVKLPTRCKHSVKTYAFEESHHGS